MKHILFDLKGCPSDLLDDEDFVRLCAWTAAKESKSELINISLSLIHISSPRD